MTINESIVRTWFSGEAPIEELMSALSSMAKDKGFWPEEKITKLPDDEYRSLATVKLMLIVTEIAEVVEELRREKIDYDKVAEEMADVEIRLLDFCGGFQIDLQDAMIKKIVKNSGRPTKHGKAF